MPIAYQKFAEKEQEKGLQEVDIKAARSYFNRVVNVDDSTKNGQYCKHPPPPPFLKAGTVLSAQRQQFINAAV